MAFRLRILRSNGVANIRIYAVNVAMQAVYVRYCIRCKAIVHLCILRSNGVETYIIALQTYVTQTTDLSTDKQLADPECKAFK